MKEGKCGKALAGRTDILGIAPFFYSESLHGAFAQSLDVIQETGWGQNMRGTCNQDKGSKLEHSAQFLPPPAGGVNQQEIKIDSDCYSAAVSKPNDQFK